MPVKKTATKKTATKAAEKTTTKHVSTAKVVETKKPTVIVETKKTDRCGCGDNCNCETWKCCCKCGCIWKIVILLLIIANVIVALLNLCNLNNKKSAWNLEALKVGWQANLEKLHDELYSNQNYIQAQKESIDAYLEQLWVN